MQHDGTSEQHQVKLLYLEVEGFPWLSGQSIEEVLGLFSGDGRVTFVPSLNPVMKHAK